MIVSLYITVIVNKVTCFYISIYNELSQSDKQLSQKFRKRLMLIFKRGIEELTYNTISDYRG